MSYQDDVADCRELLDSWLRDAADDLAGARRALQQLTAVDGPQDLVTGAGIAAALESVAAARWALAQDPVALCRHRLSPSRAPVVAAVGAMR